MVVDCHHVACVCGDWMKILKKNWGGGGGGGDLDFFQNWEKSHLNSIGKGPNSGPWEHPKKICDMVPL